MYTCDTCVHWIAPDLIDPRLNLGQYGYGVCGDPAKYPDGREPIKGAPCTTAKATCGRHAKNPQPTEE